MSTPTHDYVQQPMELRRETARTLYTSTPMTLAEVSNHVDCSERTVKRWSAGDGGWKKAGGPRLTERAQDVANQMAKAAAELETADAPSEIRDAAMADVREAIAVDGRVELMVSHRKELKVINGLLSEAIRNRNDASARLAWRIAQTLAIKQRAERLAWGLDSGEQTHTVVIERVGGGSATGIQ